jgi:hypothetical protein
MLLTLLIPVTAIILGHFVLGEPLAAREILGAPVVGSALDRRRSCNELDNAGGLKIASPCPAEKEPFGGAAVGSAQSIAALTLLASAAVTRPRITRNLDTITCSAIPCRSAIPCPWPRL